VEYEESFKDAEMRAPGGFLFRKEWWMEEAERSGLQEENHI